jgi:hypothetical protein
MVLEASSLLEEKWPKELHSGRYVPSIDYELSEETLYIISMESHVERYISPPNNAQQIGDYAEDPSLRFRDEYKTQLKRIPSS